jgi:hypothetical protein
MAWRDIEIDQLLIADLLTRESDLVDHQPPSQGWEPRDQDVTAGMDAGGHPCQTQAGFRASSIGDEAVGAGPLGAFRVEG